MTTISEHQAALALYAATLPDPMTIEEEDAHFDDLSVTIMDLTGSTFPEACALAHSLVQNRKGAGGTPVLLLVS